MAASRREGSSLCSPHLGCGIDCSEVDLRVRLGDEIPAVKPETGHRSSVSATERCEHVDIRSGEGS